MAKKLLDFRLPDDVSNKVATFTPFQWFIKSHRSNKRCCFRSSKDYIKFLYDVSTIEDSLSLAMGIVL